VLTQSGTQGPDSQSQHQRLFEVAAADEAVEGSRRHGSKPGVDQNRARPRGRGECKRSGRSRIRRRRARKERPGCFQRNAHPWILFEPPPAYECQTAAVLQRGQYVLERRHRIAEEHHAESRERGVEGRSQRVVLGVELQKFRSPRGRGARPPACHLEHGNGDVYADDRAEAPHADREIQRRCAATASYVKDVFARHGRECT
jgi:hypothetical protein